MANTIQLKRGTGAAASSTVVAEGEPVFDTGTSKLYIGDGSTALSGLTAINAGTASSLAADNLTAGDAAINLTTTTGNITIDAQQGDTDIIFKGTDGSSDITALTLDMSEAGAATFNNKVVATELDISGNVDIDGTTNLDAVDIDGAVQLDATLTIGANDQGYDVILYGDTASANLTWDTSADDLIFNGDARAVIPDGQLVLGSTAVGATAAEINAACDASARTAAAVDVSADHFLFADGGATGATKVESIADLATAMAGDGLSASSGAFAVSVDDSSIETNSDSLRVKASGITNAMLAGSIAISKLAANDITIAADSGTSHAIDLGETLTVSGTSNEVETSISNNTLTIGLPNDVTIAGDLTVNGDTTTVNTATLSVEDPLIILANGNSADSVDTGFYAKYVESSTTKYAGVFRDASATGEPFTFFDKLQAEPSTTVNTSGTGYDLADISAGGITAADGFTGNLTGDVTGNADTASALASSVNINGVAFDGSSNITVTAAGSTLSDTVTVAKGGTGATSLTDGGILLGSGTGAITATAVLGDGEMLVGDGSGDPSIESGATLRASIGCNPVTGSTSITTLGTISTGTWNGSVIASAYLDSDTAHLTGTQTFSGAKTFTANATFGANDTGVDVIFYGATSGKRMTWDESADNLVFTGGASIDGLTLDGGSF